MIIEGGLLLCWVMIQGDLGVEHCGTLGGYLGSTFSEREASWPGETKAVCADGQFPKIIRAAPDIIGLYSATCQDGTEPTIETIMLPRRLIGKEPQ